MERLKGTVWAWCEKDREDPSGYIELRSDGIANAWGLSFWRVTNVQKREVTVDDIGGAGKHVLYFNDTLTGFVCSHSGQRGFDPHKFKSPSQASVPISWAESEDIGDPIQLLNSLIASISTQDSIGFGSTTIDFEGIETTKGLSVLFGPIAYAKGSEILRLKFNDGPAPCRQVIEAKNPNFFHSSQSVIQSFQGNNVLSVSYAWAVRGGGHPDPEGFHLKRLQIVIQSYMAMDGRDPAVFLDWFSLYQLHCDEMPRTPRQTEMFDIGLRLMHVNYGHKGARVVLLTDLPAGQGLTDYHNRGWPWFERSCAACGANWVMPLQLSDAETTRLLRTPADPSTLSRFRSRREPPLLPDEFSAALDAKSMTVEADRSLIRRLYRECFETIAGSTRKLAFCNIGADDAWVARLCQALPAYRRLECLDLSGPANRLGDHGMRALLRILPGLPSLRLLYLLDARLSPQCLAEARQACRGRELVLGPSSAA